MVTVDDLEGDFVVRVPKIYPVMTEEDAATHREILRLVEETLERMPDTIQSQMRQLRA